MMRQDQSSPATDHRFSRIIGCSAFAPRKGEPSEPSVNPRKGAWVHRFPSPFQCFAPVVNPVNPYSPNKTLGDDTAAAGQRRGSLGRRHVSGGNIGKVGSLGSLGSPSDTSDHRFGPIMGYSAVAGTAGNRLGPICDPCDPCVTHAGRPMGHGIPVYFQCFDHAVTHVTHKHPNKTLGDDTATAGQHMGSDWGGQHVSGGNIGNLGSHGSHGSQVGCKRSSPATDHRFPLFLLPISPAYFSNGQENAGHGAHWAALRNPIIAFRRSGTGPSLWGRAAGTQTPEKTPSAKFFDW